MYTCDILPINSSTDSMVLLEHNACINSIVYAAGSMQHDFLCYVYDMLMFTKPLHIRTVTIILVVDTSVSMGTYIHQISLTPPPLCRLLMMSPCVSYPLRIKY